MRMVGERAIDEYIERLERSLSDVPRGRREELVSELVEHIDQTLAQAEPNVTESDVRNALDRLGDPEEIALEARARFGIRPRRVTWTDPAAIALLLAGGFLVGVGWIAGVVLLWLSDVWSVRDKIIGTLLVPGGLALPLFLGLFAPATSCSSSSTTVNGVTTTTSNCPTDTSFLAAVVLVLLVLAPIAVAVHLGRKLRRARFAPDSSV